MPSGANSTSSACLRDAGESDWPLKLHLGCGGIYLREYVNIDHCGSLSSLRPDLARQNAADIGDYYSGLIGDMGHLPPRRETVCDYRYDIRRLPYRDMSADKIVAIQVFEHLSPVEANLALRHWHGLLRLGHPLVLSVPDTIGSLGLPPEQARRQLLGTPHNPHRAWYTPETLGELLEDCGYDVECLPNFHFYPAVVVKAIRV